MTPVVVRIDGPHGITVAGMPLFIGDSEDLLDAIGELIPARAVHTVVTPNVDQVIELEEDAALRRAYTEATLRIADGMPLVRLARLLGGHGLRRLTGADLLPATASVARARGWRIALTGGAPGVSVRAAEALRRQYGADVVAVDFPKIAHVGDAASEGVVAALRAAAPDLVFVCLGSPKQDVWVSHWRDQLPPAVYVGAGAAVDFVAGTKKRAPMIVQRMGLEWVFRMSQEPRRLARRYLVRGPRFLAIAARSLRTRRAS